MAGIGGMTRKENCWADKKMVYLDEVLLVLFEAKTLGVRELKTGTMLIGHVPHVAPEAWLHQIHPPLADAELHFLESHLKKTFPAIFRQFLKRANGLNVFSSSLSIDGFRKDFSREDDAAWQPFNIITPNTVEKPPDAKDTYLFIGGYGEDGSLLYICLDDQRVFRCSRDSSKPLNQWKDFGEMLTKEVKRIRPFFDSLGRKINSGQPIVPQPTLTKTVPGSEGTSGND